MTTKTTANRLTEERLAELHAEIKELDRTGTLNIAVLAKKYGVVKQTIDYHRRKALQLPLSPSRKAGTRSAKKKRPPDLDAINADIAAGMTEFEIGRKYDLSRSAIHRMKARMKMPKRERAAAGPVEGTPMSGAAIERLMGILNRLAARHPRVFADINPLTKLAKKYPAILCEVL